MIKRQILAQDGMIHGGSTIAAFGKAKIQPQSEPLLLSGNPKPDIASLYSSPQLFNVQHV